MTSPLASRWRFESLGESGLNLMGEGGWNRTWPFTDWITGMTCAQLDQYEKDTGQHGAFHRQHHG
jgi:hypothetical protein